MAEMSDQELMNVAGDVASLEDDARIVIAGELSRRKLSESDIIQYRQDVAALAEDLMSGALSPHPLARRNQATRGPSSLVWVYARRGCSASYWPLWRR